MTHSRIDDRARAVLEGNDRGGYTVPNGRVYPFQWNWDSAFAALGFVGFDPQRAWLEIDKLLGAQWSDGFLPHIVFWKDDAGYFPGPAVWQTGKSPPTSGITQPPVVASVVRWLWESTDQSLFRPRLERMFPQLLAWHRWFHRFRDPLARGLVLAVHPWETGRDNSPEWDLPAMGIDTSRVGAYQRRDTSHVDAAMRPTQRDYDRYMALVAFGREAAWDHAKIAASNPFRVVDVGMTMILLRANRDLLALAESLGLAAEAAELRGRLAQAQAGVSYLWDEEAGSYCSRDTITGLSSGIVTSASFLSFYAGIRDERRDRRMLAHLERMAQRVKYLLPSLDPDDPRFDSIRYWRGPVWAVVSFLAATGLAEAGEKGWADRIRGDARALIELSGFYEAFCPVTGRGTGGEDFSWTAAMWLHWAGKERQAQ
jgi:mannosylglycerate hydrolase